MSDNANRGDVYSFGQFKADVSSGELEKQGKKLRLQGKPFQLLLILLERPNEIVSREDLRKRLWPANTFVEFDDGLNTAVKKLRIALCDSADEPRFIETVPRRGYRFIAPVRKEAQTQQWTAAPVAPVSSTRARVRPRHWVALATAVVLLGIVATAFGALSRKSPSGTINSIAVLPLVNLSTDEEQAYFADGVTDELITDLAKTGALRVISRTSVMRYRGTQKSIPEIARELSVDAVIEGTISRSNKRVHVRAQLIKVEPEQHIWAESYDRSESDLVELQADLAHDIAEAVRVKLRPEQFEEFARERSVNPEAHELYLKGRYFWNRRNPEGNRKAFEYFRQAIAKDPDYAPGYAGLADAYVFGGAALPVQETARLARENAEKALSLDPGLAEAHATLGLIAPQTGWNWDDTNRQLERAIELNPGFATAYQWHAEVYLATMGRMDEAIAEMRKAEQLDPLSPIIATDVGKMLFYARRYDEAEAQLKKALELDPGFLVAHEILSGVYFEKHQYARSYAELQGYRAQLDQQDYLASLIPYHLKTGHRHLAEQEMSRLLQIAKRANVDAGRIAALYAMWGRNNEAFQWLGTACDTGSAMAGTLNAGAVWEPLRADPRFDGARRCFHLM